MSFEYFRITGQQLEISVDLTVAIVAASTQATRRSKVFRDIEL